MAATSAVTILTNILVSPSEAFAAIRERPSAWLPLVVIVLGLWLTSYLYLSEVDIGWLIERQMQSAAASMTDEQRAQAVEAQARLPRAALWGFSAVAQAVAISVIFALVALYLLGASLKTGIKYKQWFAFVAWCAFPVTLGIVAQIANLLVNDARFMPQEALNPLSLANLLGIGYEGRSAAETMLLYLDATTVWSVVLQIFGYQLWTQRSTLTSASIVLGPLAAILAIAALLT
jgi:hypothetical protein